MKYIEVVEKNKKLYDSVKNEKVYNIYILSNLTLNRLKDYLEYQLRVEGINCNIVLGTYDNVVQESSKVGNYDLVIIFWELSNIIDGLNYKIELYNDVQFEDLLNQVNSNIDLVLKFLENTPLVFVNKFSYLPFSNSHMKSSKLENFSSQLNQHLMNKHQTNVKFINMNDIIARLGLDNSLDLRYYYSSKALYTNKFYEAYSKSIKPFVLSIKGKNKKALIFDCDNTLWKGIVGEDGFENIEMSLKTKDGSIFAEIQSIALDLYNKGILIGLCSKNNFSDVERVIKSHPDILLKEEYLAVIKINWDNKANNLRSISKELNIGLDSIVFIDDSPFEINLIREELPEIKVLQVPDQLYNYPKMLRENLGLFYNLSNTDEDSQKTIMYKKQVIRENEKNKYTNIEDYLASLEMKITVFLNNNSLIPRISQLTQKTNQFNLTTIRYTEAEISKFVLSDSYSVFAISVTDKFGDSGVTGLCIVKIDKNEKTVIIDTFLLSCRIIGRNIEFVFIDYIIDYLKKEGVSVIEANYLKTTKNQQVEEFYENNSFLLIRNLPGSKYYKLEVDKYIPKNINYIRIENG